MKAAITTQWNQIAIEDLPRPVPGPGECLVRPTYTGICGSDVHVYLGHHPTAKAPVVQGHEFVGLVEEIGPGPAGLLRGDRVGRAVDQLRTLRACRMGNWHVCRTLKLHHANGAFAETVRVACESRSCAQGLTIKGRDRAAVGMHVCRRRGVRGRPVLVIGAGPTPILGCRQDGRGRSLVL